MKKLKLSDALTWWILTGFTFMLWLGTAFIFSDLCLSFGGGDNSACRSHFNYPEFLQVIAIVFFGSAPVVIIFLTVISILMSAMKYFSSGRENKIQK